VQGVRLPNWLGDALLARRALDAISARCGQEQLIISGRSPHIALLGADYVTARWQNTDHGPRSAWELGRAWRRDGVERVWLFPTSLSSRLAGLVSGAGERIGFGPRPGARPELEAGLFLTRHVSRGALGSRHLEDEYLDLAGGIADTPARRNLTLSPGTEEAARERLAGLSSGPYAVLSPGARYGPAKRWGVARFAEAARRLSESGNLPTVVVGEESDAPLCRRLAEVLGPGTVDLAGKTNLAELAGVLAGATGVIANDSGTAHLAAALGRPTVVIFGSTEPAWTAPRGKRVAVVREKIRCSPCFRRSCRLDDAYSCLRLVEPETVVASFVAMVGREAA
jgi:heptosyltransferase-2